MKKIGKTVAILLSGVVTLSIVVVGSAFGIAKSENKRFKSNNIQNQETKVIDLALTKYNDLPTPVAKYLEYAFNGQKSIEVKNVTWNEKGDFLLPVGEFKTNGKQTSVAYKPIYLWEGTYYNTVLPIPMLDSRDGFLIDAHNMRAKLFGLMKVMQTDYTNQEDIDNLHAYLMLRYYGTAVNFPWALLPNEYVEWEAIDDLHAYLVIKYNNLDGKYLVTFNNEFQIIKMETEGSMLHGNNEHLREVGEKLNYQEVNGFKVPVRMEYYWYNEDDSLDSKYHFDITNIKYN